MMYCYDCGAECIDGAGSVPSCAAHGPRWKLIRNAPTADVLIERDGRVLLTRRTSGPQKGRWATLGGFVELGEHPEEAARREAHEELGMTITISRLIGIFVDRYEEGWTQCSVYLATSEQEPAVGDGEVVEWAWFLPREIPDEMAWNHRRRVEPWIAARV